MFMKSPLLIKETRPMKQRLVLKATLPKDTPSMEVQLLVCRFNQEDSLAACGYSDGKVNVFNLATDNKVCELDTKEDTRHGNNKSLDAKSEKNIDTAGSEKNIGSKQTGIDHINHPVASNSYQLPQVRGGPVNSLRWRPAMTDSPSSLTSVLLVANSSGHLFQYSAKTAKQLWHTYEEDNYILATDYAPDGTYFVTGGKDNIVRVYDEDKKQVITELKGVKWQKGGHNNRIFCVRCSPTDRNTIISGGWDQNINVWDLRTSMTTHTLYGPKISGDSLDIHDNLLISGANRADNQLELWDLGEAKIVKSWKWDLDPKYRSTPLFFTQFCHYNPRHILAGGGTQAKLFDIDAQGSTNGEQDTFSVIFGQEEKMNAKEETANTSRQSVYSCDSSHNGQKYLVGGKTGLLYHIGTNKLGAH